MSPTRYPSPAYRKQTFKLGEQRAAAVRAEVASWPGGVPPEESARDIVLAVNLLPDVPGYVHGIVQAEPVWVVQCDGCGRVAVGDRDPYGRRSTLVIQFCGILFDHRAGDSVRLCFRCRLENDLLRPWDESPADLEFHEKFMHEREPALFAPSESSAQGGTK